MSDYFHELGCEPLEEGQTPNHYLHLARLLRDFGLWEDLPEGHKQPPPASKEIVNNLPNKTAHSPEEQCAICLKSYESNDVSKTLPCNHTFHPECILPWLSKTNSCPVCRFELRTDDENYEQYRKDKLRSVQREKDIEELHNSMFG